MTHSAEWTQWWQDDLPCRFSLQDALANAAILSDVLGASFLGGANHPIAQVRHPILRLWKTRGANSFIQINTLACDLEVVSSVEGFETIVHDLRNRHTCLAAWHTVHTAALLARGAGSRLLRFLPQTDLVTPDFIVEHGGLEVMCEAKLLAQSGPEEVFGRYAALLSSKMKAEVLNEERLHPTVTIVVRNFDSLPPIEQVIAVAEEGVGQFADAPIEYRSAAFNIFIDAPSQDPVQVTSGHSIYILCPKSEREDLRVQRRGADASRQLSSEVGEGRPGLLLLGITELQDPGYVADLFRRRFADGQYRGIAGVLMIHAGIHMGEPLRAPLDLVASIRNEQNPNRLPNLPVQQVGLLGQLPPHSSETIPAYRHLSTEALTAAGSNGLVLPDLRTLDPGMLSSAPPSRMR